MSNRDQQLESTLFHSLALDASLTFVSFRFVLEMCVCVILEDLHGQEFESDIQSAWVWVWVRVEPNKRVEVIKQCHLATFTLILFIDFI